MPPPATPVCDPLERARSGEIDALEAIYRSFAPGVTTLARRLLGRLTAAEDLAQDVFVDVLTKLDQYDGRGSFAGWVRIITVTRCLMQLRTPWRRGLRLVTHLGAESRSGARLLERATERRFSAGAGMRARS